MNYLGKTVQVNLPDTQDYKDVNNQQLKASAIVTADFNPTSEGQDKLLNLRIMMDSMEDPIWATSVPHRMKAGEGNMSWELLEWDEK